MDSLSFPTKVSYWLSKASYLETEKGSNFEQGTSYADNIEQFNIAPMPPGDVIHLNPLQTACFQMLNEPKYSSLYNKLDQNNTTLQALSPNERKQLDHVNFMATQMHLEALCKSWNESYITQASQLPDYCEAVVAEILAKSLAYNTHIESGTTINLPIKMENGRFELVEFGINATTFQTDKDRAQVTDSKYSILPTIGDQLPYLMLTPIDTHSKIASWMVIRGSETLDTKDAVDHAESITADTADSQGVSSLPVWSKASELTAMLAKESQNGEKPINIVGHSLGGALAQNLAVLAHPFCNRCYAFNSPGVDKNIKDLYDQCLTNNDKKKFIGFHQKGDIASASSPCVIGTNYVIKPDEGREGFNPISPHADIFLTRSFEASQVDNKKTNKSLALKFANWSRHSILSRLTYVSHKALWWEKRETYRSFAEAYLSWMETHPPLQTKVPSPPSVQKEEIEPPQTAAERPPDIVLARSVEHVI